jgi:hypothetical protein
MRQYHIIRYIYQLDVEIFVKNITSKEASLSLPLEQDWTYSVTGVLIIS